MADFQSEGLVLDAEGVVTACDTLRVPAAELWAVLIVETRGCGFLPDRRPLILFERAEPSQKALYDDECDFLNQRGL